jgi:UDP-N-acetylmuramyl pentapeptide phosphotransferase/UDP-N-acetylglucosamine-1-phosphate transferase
VALLLYGDLVSLSHWSFSPEPERANCLVLAGALLGCLLGFLKFNRRPARVFLGDTGSLPLGGLLGLLTLVSGNQLACLVVGAVFVAELSSVGLQVTWFKSSGKRLFRCAPLHHHFQFGGWSEARVVRSFCAIAAVCAGLGIVLEWTNEETRATGVTAAIEKSTEPRTANLTSAETGEKRR